MTREQYDPIYDVPDNISARPFTTRTKSGKEIEGLQVSLGDVGNDPNSKLIIFVPGGNRKDKKNQITVTNGSNGNSDDADHSRTFSGKVELKFTREGVSIEDGRHGKVLLDIIYPLPDSNGADKLRDSLPVNGNGGACENGKVEPSTQLRRRPITRAAQPNGVDTYNRPPRELPVDAMMQAYHHQRPIQAKLGAHFRRRY